MKYFKDYNFEQSHDGEDVLLIYHKEDNDGVFSGALLYDYFIYSSGIKSHQIYLLGTNYNELTVLSKTYSAQILHNHFRYIIMTDISFNDEKYMKSLYKEFGNHFIWCDHHAPIIEASRKLNFSDAIGVRDTSRSAILCVWKWLYDPFDESYNKRKVPELLRILSAWDSWSFEHQKLDSEYCRKINKAVTYQYNLDFENVLDLIHVLHHEYNGLPGDYNPKKHIKELLKIGTLLCDYEDRTFEDLLKNIGDLDWKIITDNKTYTDSHGTWGPSFRSACAIFHQGQTNSKMFNSLRKTHPDIMNAIVFKHNPNSNWAVTIYNIRECDEKDWPGRFHCGKFMKEHYKGGGHIGAAGCTITQDQFIKILKKKEL